jgi:hypothetical protein
MATANPDSDTVSVLVNSTGLCTVPNVKGKTLLGAKRMIIRARCRVGKVSRAYSRVVTRSRVMSEKPRPGTVPSLACVAHPGEEGSPARDSGLSRTHLARRGPNGLAMRLGGFEPPTNGLEGRRSSTELQAP